MVRTKGIPFFGRFFQIQARLHRRSDSLLWAISSGPWGRHRGHIKSRACALCLGTERMTSPSVFPLPLRRFPRLLSPHILVSLVMYLGTWLPAGCTVTGISLEATARNCCLLPSSLFHDSGHEVSSLAPKDTIFWDPCPLARKEIRDSRMEGSFCK